MAKILPSKNVAHLHDLAEVIKPRGDSHAVLSHQALVGHLDISGQGGGAASIGEWKVGHGAQGGAGAVRDSGQENRAQGMWSRAGAKRERRRGAADSGEWGTIGVLRRLVGHLNISAQW